MFNHASSFKRIVCIAIFFLLNIGSVPNFSNKSYAANESLENELKTKTYFKELIDKKYFERFIVLSKRNGVGTIEGVFDENYFAMYLPYLK